MHGAGSGPWIFEPWSCSFEGWRVELADLQAGLDVAEASMADYADVVVERATAHAPRPLVLCGWSLGGLVVLMAAERLRPDLVVLLEPSPPAEVQGSDPGLPLVFGTFDPEGAYGLFLRASRRGLNRRLRAQSASGASACRRFRADRSWSTVRSFPRTGVEP